jgi:hypothetical protein
MAPYKSVYKYKQEHAEQWTFASSFIQPLLYSSAMHSAAQLPLQFLARNNEVILTCTHTNIIDINMSNGWGINKI